MELKFKFEDHHVFVLICGIDVAAKIRALTFKIIPRLKFMMCRE